MHLVEVGWGDVDWIGMAKDRNRWRALVNWVMNLRVPYNVGKLSSGDFSSSAKLRGITFLSVFLRLIDDVNTLLLFSTLSSLL
jgi:hypothetical protein